MGVKSTEDAYLWAKETAAALRARDWGRIDADELAEEVEGLARELEFELQVEMKNAINALLSLSLKPDDRTAKIGLAKARSAIWMHLDSAPSARLSVLPAEIGRAYAWAVQDMQEDLGVALPAECPWNADQVLGLDPAASGFALAS